MVIRATDRVSAVLARDERLVEVFTSLAPTFEKLRNPAMRKVMARLVTVEQAARVAGVDPELLLERLNGALEGAADVEGAAPENGPPAAARAPKPQTTPDAASAPGATHSPGAPAHSRANTEMPITTGPAGLPAILAAKPEELIVDLDVRPDLRRGEEPFSKIMAAKRQVPPGGVLRLRATFEPVPLYAVLGKQGMEHWTERFADDDWRVWFYTPPAEPETLAAPGTALAADPAQTGTPATPHADPADDIVILDVRGLEPPEPMMRTFEALEKLPYGKTLIQLNVRIPQFLLPQLAARGFTYEIREQSKDLVRLFIRHAAGGE